jgi:hypothetical protein
MRHPSLLRLEPPARAQTQAMVLALTITASQLPREEFELWLRAGGVTAKRSWLESELGLELTPFMSHHL